MRYEYRILQTNAPTASEKQLTEQFGEDGWLLIQIVEWNKWYYYFAKSTIQ